MTIITGAYPELRMGSVDWPPVNLFSNSANKRGHRPSSGHQSIFERCLDNLDSQKRGSRPPDKPRPQQTQYINPMCEADPELNQHCIRT